jgi:GT2 family glycosyltransferase
MTTSAAPKFSVVITNYNYANFIARAIDSVLSQDVEIELVVVDDCSTDNSREVIRSYGDRVIPVFLAQNVGQGGGFNAGLECATGDLVQFLDADDFLLPGAANRILANYDPDVAMYLYRMRYADLEDNLGEFYPPLQVPFANGDVSARLRDIGSYSGTITSGMVFARWALQRIVPVNAEAFAYGGDGYLTAAVPLYGPVRGLDEAICGYRLHPSQHTQFAKNYAKRGRWRIEHHQARHDVIRSHSARLGLEVAEDIGERDADHLQERLISIIFDPGAHPVQSDTRKNLLQKLRRANRLEYGSKALPKNAWWILMGILPNGAARTLLSWKIDVAARPVWMNNLGRTLRKRLGIVTN